MGQPSELVIERYKFILQQLDAANQNVYKFLGIYQALATALTAAGLTLLVSYQKWGLEPELVRTAALGIGILITVIAAFTCVLIVIGVMVWLDYRREESDLTDRYIYAGFRPRASHRNLWRWYETYVILFILASLGVLWIGGLELIHNRLG